LIQQTTNITARRRSCQMRRKMGGWFWILWRHDIQIGLEWWWGTAIGRGRRNLHKIWICMYWTEWVEEDWRYIGCQGDGPCSVHRQERVLRSKYQR
jgi:hypothetical protein